LWSSLEYGAIGSWGYIADYGVLRYINIKMSSYGVRGGLAFEF